MTHNQIEYWKLREEERANRIKEAETERSNRANESINEAKRAEDVRHNIESEVLSKMSLEEQARHNTVTEGETVRSNMAKESLSKYQTDTSAAVGFNAANLGLEGTTIAVAENMRHNLEMEAYNTDSLNRDYLIRSVQNQIKAKELGVSSSRAVEEARHQKAVENETNRANLVREKQKWVDTAISGVKTLSDIRANKAKSLGTILKLIPLVGE